MFFDGLGEIRPHELGATLAPLQIVLAEDYSLRGAGVITAAEMIDLAAETIDGVAAVLLKQGHGCQTELPCGGIAALTTPEALVLLISNIEKEERIG